MYTFNRAVCSSEQGAIAIDSGLIAPVPGFLRLLPSLAPLVTTVDLSHTIYQLFSLCQPSSAPLTA